MVVAAKAVNLYLSIAVVLSLGKANGLASVNTHQPKMVQAIELVIKAVNLYLSMAVVLSLGKAIGLASVNTHHPEMVQAIELVIWAHRQSSTGLYPSWPSWS